MLPNARKKTRGHVSCLKTLNKWPETSRSSILHFILFIFGLKPTIPPVFNQTLKSQFNSPVLISLKSFVRRKPIPVFDPRPLYCSSLTTAVLRQYEELRNINFVDSAHLTVVRIIRLERHKGLSARSPVALFDEVIYLAQATLPKESDQLRLERHKGLSARSPVARFEEVIYSAQATQPKVSDQLRVECHQGLSGKSLVARFDEVIY